MSSRKTAVMTMAGSLAVGLLLGHMAGIWGVVAAGLLSMIALVYTSLTTPTDRFPVSEAGYRQNAAPPKEPKRHRVHGHPFLTSMRRQRLRDLVDIIQAMCIGLVALTGFVVPLFLTLDVSPWWATVYLVEAAIVAAAWVFWPRVGER